MSVQTLPSRSLGIAILGTAFRARVVDRAIHPVFLLFTFHILFLSPIVLVLTYNILIYPHISPLRHIPTAAQKPLLQRLFKEPNAFHFERWINELPDVEMIRYFGFLNGERLLCTTPAGINQVLRLQDTKFEKQYVAKSQLKRVAGSAGLVVTEGLVHKTQRRALDPGFRLGQIKTRYYPLFWSKAAEMLELITNETETSGTSSHQGAPVVCMDDIIGRTVFDIIGQASIGVDWQALRAPRAYWRRLAAYREIFVPSKDNRNAIILSFALPKWLLDWVPMRFNLVTGKAIKEVRNLCRKHIQACHGGAVINKEEGPADIISSAMRTNKLSFEEIQDQALMFQGGGHHSSVIAMLSTIYFLAQHQHVQDRLREEIRQTLMPCTPGATIDPDVFTQMPYLQAVRAEVLRLFSAFSWTGRTPMESVTILGTAIPKETCISLSPWALHRSYRLWGSDAKDFKPERWLGGASSVPKQLCSFISFGAGPHKCIGEEFAKAEMNCIIAALFGRYKMSFGDDQSVPGVTHQSTVAFRKQMIVQLELVEGW